MPVVKQSHEQVEKIYEKVVDLLEEISLLASEEEADDEQGYSEHQFVEDLLEDAVERGLDEESIARVLRTVMMMRRKAREG